MDNDFSQNYQNMIEDLNLFLLDNNMIHFKTKDGSINEYIDVNDIRIYIEDLEENIILRIETEDKKIIYIEIEDISNNIKDNGQILTVNSNYGNLILTNM